MLPRVSSRVSGFPVASPCLWGTLQDLSFSKVSKQVVMLFCVAGAALCDIPTCLITRRKSFCCACHTCVVFTRWVAVFVAGAPFWRSLPSFCVALQMCRIASSTLHTPHPTPHFTLHTSHSKLQTRHSRLHTPHFTLQTLHSILYTPHSTLHTLHFTLHTLHSILYTPDSTLHTLHATFFHFPQSTAHWYGNRGKYTRLFK